MKVQVIRSNRKTIGLEVRADESVILRAPAVDEISDVEWKSILGEFTERVNHFLQNYGCHHSAEFWQEVEKYCKTYRECRKKLRDYEI